MDVTSAVPRPATDAAAITACVQAAYQRYVGGIGRLPGPMLEDDQQVVRNHRAYVIEEGGRPGGALVLKDTDDGIVLDSVAVLPSRQGEGFGRRLVEHADSEARRLGHDHLGLCTHQRMTGNIAMYARYGYEEFDCRTEHGFPRVSLCRLL